MSEAIVEYIARLSFRERLLLACLTGLLMPALLLWGFALPVVERRDVSYRALLEARAEQDWLARIQAEHTGLMAEITAFTESNSELVGLGGIEASLRASGLQESVAELGTTAADEISLRFEEIGFVDLMSWLQRTEQEAGYSLVRLQLSQGEHKGGVIAEIQLKQVTGAAQPAPSP